MRFGFHVAGMPVTAEVLEQQSLGGSETMGALMARALVELGHQVTLYANADRPHSWRGVWIEPIGQVTDKAPLGERYHQLVQVTPLDALIVQRHPTPFPLPTLSKTRWWWAHDLGRSRLRGHLKGSLWNCQGIFGVTDWHCEQLTKSFGLPTGYAKTLRNGIDLSLFSKQVPAEVKRRGKRLVYSSRPERGLRYLVQPGGIMEQLYKLDPEITLQVCGYDNTVPEMAHLYETLKAQCLALPNVEIVGALNKQQLADLLAYAALWVYPTVPAKEHEETSCISLMECQAAGTPFIVCDGGAVRETTLGEGDNNGHPERGRLIPYLASGEADTDAFVASIQNLLDPKWYESMSNHCRTFAQHYDYRLAARDLEALIGRTLAEQSANPVRLATHLCEQGDVLLARVPLQQVTVVDEPGKFPQQPTAYLDEQMQLSRFVTGDPKRYQQHYDRSAELLVKYTGAEKLDGKWNLNSVASIPHFQELIAVLDLLSQRGPMRILDYGCNLGTFTMFLAKRYPDSDFTGAEISQELVDRANAQTEKNGPTNTSFLCISHPDRLSERKWDVVICAETLEHVREDAGEFVAALERRCKPGGYVLLTVPANRHDLYKRAAGEEERTEHVRCIEHEEVTARWGKKPEFNVRYFGISENKWFGGAVVGQLIQYRADHTELVAYDPMEKLTRQAPRELLSVLVICRGDDHGKLEGMLRSVHQVADEIVVGLDESHYNVLADHMAWDMLLAKFPKLVKFTLTKQPLRDGFDAARNEVLDRCRFDWILWLDADEVLLEGQHLLRYLQRGAYVGFGLEQHHLAVDGDKGTLKVDLPVRLFRKDSGMRFHGFVHEHPSVTSDKPPEHVMLIGKPVAIAHPGYVNEEVRRARFERNLPLMEREAREHPDRPLNGYLWARDLMHKVRFKLERGAHPQQDEEIQAWSKECVTVFDKLREGGDLHLIREAAPYYNQAVNLLHGQGAYQFRMVLEARRMGVLSAGAQNELELLCPERADAEAAINLFVKSALDPLSERYL